MRSAREVGIVTLLLVAFAGPTLGCGSQTSATLPSSSSQATVTGVAPPAWLEGNIAAVLTTSAQHVSHVNWVLTTARQAAPLMGLSQNDPSVSADPGRHVYLYLVAGLWPPPSPAPTVSPAISPSQGAVTYHWLMMQVDVQSRRIDGQNATVNRPNTSAISGWQTLVYH
jgi:hypothetical protein